MKNAERGWNGSVFVRERKWWGGCSTRDKNEKIYDAALLVACSDLYTVKYTVMCTVVYTVRTVYGDFGRFFTNIYEQKRVENIKESADIQRVSVKYRLIWRSKRDLNCNVKFL